MAVVMSMMMMAECEHADQVDEKTQGTDDEQFCQALGLPTLEDSLKGLKHDLDTNQDQEDTVGKATERLNLAKSIRKSLTWRPLARDGREKAHCQSYTVEEHVYTIAEQTKRVCHIAIECLDHHERKVEPNQSLDVSRFTSHSGSVYQRTT